MILNDQTPTREDPRNHTLTAIDLSLSTSNINDITWKINQYDHNPSYSDHFNIFIKISFNNSPDEQIYHSTWNLTSGKKWVKYTKKLKEEMKKLEYTQNPNTNAT